MPSSRTVVLSGLAVFGLVVVAGVAALLLFRDDPAPIRGDLIVYGCREPGNPWYAICVMRSDGTDKRQLTTDLAASDPTWSPDGRRIAFTRHEDIGEFSRSTADDVFTMDARGGDLQLVTPERVGQSSWHPAWSPDGREIAFLRSGAVASEAPTRFGALLAIRVDGGDTRSLSKGLSVSDLAWSPDGRELAFTLDKHESPTRASLDLYVIDFLHGRLRPLTSTPSSFETAPAWSPDGSRIAFARWTLKTQFDGKGAVYVMNHDGTGEKLVLAHQHFATGPYNLTWSPDGRSLAYETSHSILCTAISVIALEGGAPRALTSCTKAIESTVAPAWQPDTRSEKR